MEDTIKLFSGNAHQQLARGVADLISQEYKSNVLGKIKIFEFSNGETFASIKESIRGKDIFVFQPLCYSEPIKHHNWISKRSCNDNFMEMLIIIDACRRSSAGSITCVIPYYGYARSDKKDQSGVPITAKMIASILENAGVNRVITFDLHSSQIQGFFNIPVDNLSASYLFAKTITQDFTNVQVIVSPDSGGVGRARELSKRINWIRYKKNRKNNKNRVVNFKKTKVAFGDKRRTSNNDNAKVTYIIGNVKNKSILIYDDIVDTAGSLVEVAEVLKKRGAKKVYAACVHAVLSSDSLERIENSDIEKMYITDTIPLENNKKNSKISVISIKDILAKSIIKVYKKESVAQLFRIDIEKEKEGELSD